MPAAIKIANLFISLPSFRARRTGLIFTGRIQIAADAFHFTHNAQSIFTQNFPYVTLGIAFFEQSLGDERQLAGVFHAVGHVGAVEIRAEAYMIGACNSYGVIDVLDDFFVAYAG